MTSQASTQQNGLRSSLDRWFANRQRRSIPLPGGVRQLGHNQHVGTVFLVVETVNREDVFTLGQVLSMTRNLERLRHHCQLVIVQCGGA